VARAVVRESVFVIVDELPIALPDGAGGTVDARGVIMRVVPEKGTRGGRGFAAEERKQADAVARFVGGHGGAGDGEQRGEKVGGTGGCVGGGSGRDRSGPAHDERNAQAAFVELGFAAAEGRLRRVFETAAVVGSENDERVLAEVEGFEFCEDFAD